MTIEQHNLNDLCKGVSILTGIIAIAISFSSINIGYGESDFTIEATVNKPHLNFTKFEIQDQGYKEMCPSGQCKIDYSGDKYTNFVAPSADLMYFTAFNNFNLPNNVSNADMGPKKKEFMEKFTIFTLCRVKDIIEENGQEIYTCHNGTTLIDRKFDGREWRYDTTTTFDAKKNTLKAHGNLIK